MIGFKQIWLGLGAIIGVVAVLVAWKLGPALAPPNHLEVGIPVGEPAPLEISLKSIEGNDTNLATLMGDNGLVLLMTRSVDWCPFCMAQLIESNEIASEVAERGYQLVGLSYDPPASLTRFTKDENINYFLVSDQQSEFIDAVGLRDPQYSEDPDANGVPYATVLLIGTDGVVKDKLVSDDYRKRPSNDYVLGMIDEVTQ